MNEESVRSKGRSSPRREHLVVGSKLCNSNTAGDMSGNEKHLTLGVMRVELILILVFLTSLAHGSGEALPLGARFAGMENTGLTLVEVWSMRLNLAGIAGLERPTAGIFYQKHFLSQEFASQALAFTVPLGITADHFGYTISHYRAAQRCAAIFPVGGIVLSWNRLTQTTDRRWDFQRSSKCTRRTARS